MAHKFGGDPDHVVIHGASAGAGSVALHMAAYGGRDDGLFVGAIAESVFFPALPAVPELEWQFDRLAASVGCGADAVADQMGCLRAKETAVLQAAHVSSPFPGADGSPLFYWTPCVDGRLVADRPYALFQRGHLVDVPFLIGTDTDEGSVFAANAATPARAGLLLRRQLPPSGGQRRRRRPVALSPPCGPGPAQPRRLVPLGLAGLRRGHLCLPRRQPSRRHRRGAHQQTQRRRPLLGLPLRRPRRRQRCRRHRRPPPLRGRRRLRPRQHSRRSRQLLLVQRSSGAPRHGLLDLFCTHP